MNPMEESVTYQAIMRKGRLIEARRILLILGQKRFGPADESTMANLNAIDDVQKLDKLIDRVLDVGNWQELVQPTKRRQHNGRRRGNI
jgi:hypothetical protein